VFHDERGSQPEGFASSREGCSMRFPNLLAAFLVLVPAPLSAVPALADVLIEIDKGTQQMTVTVDGAPRHTWPVSTGTLDRATPAGSFQPFRLAAQHVSREWDNAPMPHSIFFTQSGHAIHGSQAVARLGTPASHGCVRLSPANAATLYSLVEWEGLQNTRVVITGTEAAQVAKAEAPQGDVSGSIRPASPSPRQGSEADENEGIPGESVADDPPEARPDAQATPKPRKTPAAPARRERGLLDENESIFADSFGDGSPGEEADTFSYHVYPDEDGGYPRDFDTGREWN
jgi:hypothetical protein